MGHYYILGLVLGHFLIAAHPFPQHHSTYPFPSDNTFRCFCNHGDPVINNAKGDIMYISNFRIDHFFSKIHPHIRAPYILISHEGWHSVPGAFGKYLDDPKLIAWFAKNVDRTHPKLFPLPIGIPNKQYIGGNLTIIQNTIRNAKPTTQRRNDKLIYLNLTIGSNRQAAVKALKNKPFTFYQERVPFAQYMNQLSQFKFVASPNGLGVDCHRTWEAMLVGTIPIVTRSSICKMFDDLPVLIIDSWDQVTREFLEEKFEEITSKSYNLKKLYADYWFDQISQIQKKNR